MAEHVRITRNRREFVSDAFCGFGALALAGNVLLNRSIDRVGAAPAVTLTLVGADGAATG